MRGPQRADRHEHRGMRDDQRASGLPGNRVLRIRAGIGAQRRADGDLQPARVDECLDPFDEAGPHRADHPGPDGRRGTGGGVHRSGQGVLGGRQSGQLRAVPPVCDTGDLRRASQRRRHVQQPADHLSGGQHRCAPPRQAHHLCHQWLRHPDGLQLCAGVRLPDCCALGSHGLCDAAIRPAARRGRPVAAGAASRRRQGDRLHDAQADRRRRGRTRARAGARSGRRRRAAGCCGRARRRAGRRAPGGHAHAEALDPAGSRNDVGAVARRDRLQDGDHRSLARCG